MFDLMSSAHSFQHKWLPQPTSLLRYNSNNSNKR